MESHLEGNFSTDEATILVDLASKCLQYEPKDRPSIKELVMTLAPLQIKCDVSISFSRNFQSLFLFLGNIVVIMGLFRFHLM